MRCPSRSRSHRLKSSAAGNDESFATDLCGHFRDRRQPHIGIEPQHRRAGCADSLHLGRGHCPLRAVRAEIAQNPKRGC